MKQLHPSTSWEKVPASLSENLRRKPDQTFVGFLRRLPVGLDVISKLSSNVFPTIARVGKDNGWDAIYITQSNVAIENSLEMEQFYTLYGTFIYEWRFYFSIAMFDFQRISEHYQVKDLIFRAAIEAYSW